MRTLPWQGEQRLALVTEWIDDTVPIGRFVGKTLPALQQDQLAKHYLGAALNGNWDVVGMEFDNLVRFGRTWRCIDQGGAFMFRARGGKKAYDAVVAELDSLLSPGRKARQVFEPIMGRIESDPDKYIDWLQDLSDQKIKNAVADAGLAADLAATISQRRDYIIDHVRKFKKAEAGVFFKNPAHNALYERAIKEYEGLDAKAMRARFREQCPVSRQALDKWRGTTQSEQPMGFKYKAELMESRHLDTFSRRRLTKQQLKAHADAIPDEEYIRIRAMTQAYYSSTGVRNVKLYRGTDGKKSGPAYRRRVSELRSRYPKQWEQMTVELKETSLVGWSDERSIAAAFGHNSGGITIGMDMPVEDILLSHEIWPKNSYMREKEFLVFGSPGRSVLLKHIDI